MSPTFFRAFNSLPLGARNNNNNSRNKNNTSKQRSTSIHVNPQTPLSPRQQQPSTERHGDARETSTKYREPRSRISMSSLKLRLKRATSSLKASLSRSPRPSSMSCHDGGILISATVVSPEPVVLLSFNIMVEETEDVDEENDVPVIESEEVRGDTNLFNGAVTAGATAVSDVTSTDVEPNPPFSPESLTSTSSSTSRIIICGEGNSERRLDYCSSEADTCCNNNVQHAIANGMDQRQQCRGTQKQQMQQQQQQQQQQQMQPQKRIEHRGLSHERRREEEAETENENENEGSKKAPLMPETIPTTTILTVECEGESEHQGRAVAGGTVDVEVVVGKSGHIHATTTIIATTRTTTITPATLFSTSTAKLHDNEEKEDKEGERDRLHHHHAELQYQQEKDKHTRQQHERDHHIHHHHHHQQSHLQPQEKGEEEDDVEDTGREYCPSIILHGKKKQRHSENVEDAEQETHGVHCPSSCYLLGPDLHTATSRTTTPSPFFFSQTPSPPPSPSTPPLAFARSRIPTEEYVPRRLFTENVTPPSPPPAAAPAVTMITHDDNRPRMQNPASRFEILERLGYGN
ncbi:hypothetical protein EDD21DRAFT_359782 [Dissophora ornata]|nr:hypothetical protein EDD21DRAFT_359782 [Dissophora ornata]